MLPTVVKFDYNGTPRVAIEREVKPHGCILCTQVVPEVGYRSYKVAKRRDLRRLGPLKSLYYTFKALRT